MPAGLSMSTTPFTAFLYFFLGGYPPSYQSRVRPGHNPSVFITGTDEGIGRAIALHFARNGYTVFAGILWALHPSRFSPLTSSNLITTLSPEEYARDPSATRGRLHPIVCNVLSDDSIRRCIDKVANFDQTNPSRPLIGVSTMPASA